MSLTLKLKSLLIYHDKLTAYPYLTYTGARFESQWTGKRDMKTSTGYILYHTLFCFASLEVQCSFLFNTLISKQNLAPHLFKNNSSSRQAAEQFQNRYFFFLL